MKRNAILRFFVLLLAVVAMPALAATHYVATGGDDGSPGTRGEPWRTLQHAANNIAGGDTIVVRGGRYAGVQFGASASGSPGDPTVLKAGPGETPIIISDGGHGAGINLEGVSWMVVQGFTVNDRSDVGIRVVGGKQWGLSCAHVTLRGNHLDHNGKWGIFTAFCDDLVIENNVASRSARQHGIYVSNSGDRPVIRGNRVWGNHGSGIQLNGDASAGGDGIIRGAVIAGNIIHDNGRGGGSAINLDGVQDAIIRNNLLYDNHASGISLFRIDGGGPSSGNRVVNNSIIMARDARWALNLQNGAVNTTVHNNILLNRNPRRGSIQVSSDSLAGLTSDYNVVMPRLTAGSGSSHLGLKQWQARGFGAHSRAAELDSLFVDAAQDDYHLSPASPAIDAGASQADVDSDIEDTPRPQGEGFDIGAYEYQGPTAVSGERQAAGH